MKKRAILAIAFGAAALMALPFATDASAKNRPLSLHANDHTAPAVAAGAGTAVGVAAYNSWFFGPAALTSATQSGAVAAAGASGIIGAAATLVGYEAIGCRTLGVDPFNMCLRHSWRVSPY